MSANPLPAYLRQLKATAESCGQRPVAWLAGGTADAYQAVAALGLDYPDSVWISPAFGRNRQQAAAPYDAVREQGIVIPAHRSHVLGTQSDVLIYDAHEGFDPDLFCLAAGTLRSGGLLVLLAPAPDVWRKVPDPDYERMLVYPHSISAVRCRFMSRVVDGLWQSPVVAVWSLADASPIKALAATLPVSHPLVAVGGGINYTEDQQILIKRVVELVAAEPGDAVAGAHVAGPMAVTADRGRGKSAALGAAVAALQPLRPDLCVWVTAPHRDNVRVLFSHCADVLGVDSYSFSGRLQIADFQVEYVAPDEVIDRLSAKRNAVADNDCDVLVVDEAAGIPDGMLDQFVAGSPCTLLATTVHGYEGTGRGFEVRLRPRLQAAYPGSQWLTLRHPIRWGDNDLLESCLNDSFMMAPSAGDFMGDLSEAGDLSVRRLSQDELCSPATSNKQRGWLEPLFRLLMRAHYRTSPGDLRDLMDGLNLEVFVLLQGEQLVGCCLVALEGGLPADLIEDIYQGKRRPRGHLLPQTLCQCLGFREPAAAACARVVRIAVSPQLQGQGLGSRLLVEVEAILRQEGVALIGSSFSAYPEVVGFWQSNDYLPVRLGFTREASSGAHALLVAKALDDTSVPFVTRMNRLFSESLPYLHQNELRSLSLPLIDVIAGQAASAPLRASADRDVWLSQVQGFAAGYRTFADSRFGLWCFLQQPTTRTSIPSLPAEQRLLLDTVFAENRCVKELRALQIKLSKNQAVANLRLCFQRLLASQEC